MSEEANEVIEPANDAVDHDQAVSEVNTPDAKEAEWRWNSDFAGTGEAPEWLNQAKYGDVAAQAKAYTDLESRFGGFTGAPESYTASLPEDLVLPEGVELDFDDQDPIFQAIAPVAAELQMSQEGLDKMLGAYWKATAEQLDQERIQAQDYALEEMKSIPQGQQRVDQVNSWAKANLDDESYSAFVESVTDARSLQMFEHLINKSRTAPLPTPSEQQTNAYTKDDIDQMFRETDEQGRNRYTSDPSFRQRVQRLMGMSH